MPEHIHVFGASGSGTTSLAAAIAAKYGHCHLDTDDFYWLPTNPPFTQKRPRLARLELLRAELARSRSWVLSGSLCEWGDPLVPEFDLVVFLVVPTEIRMARLRARELSRYGPEAIAPGGSLHRAHGEFLDWASRYDSGGLDMRSRALHDEWFEKVTVHRARLEGDRPVADQLAELERLISARGLPT